MTIVTRALVTGLLALGLTACVSPSNNPPAAIKPVPADDKCNASQVADLVGQPYNAAMLARVKAAVGHVNIRPIRPNQAVTMDYREDRLNIDIDKDEKIVGFRCS